MSDNLLGATGVKEFVRARYGGVAMGPVSGCCA
jgi:hypothetical protein